MLIRTQDKTKLIEFSNITIIEISKENFNIQTPSYFLGIYSSKEKALKVLDMIEAKYLEPVYINDIGGNEYAKYEHKVFHMPADDEVEINE